MSGPILSPSEKELWKVVFVVNELLKGRSLATGDVTLTAGATSTTVSAPNCGPDSKVFLFPQTATAAAVVASTFISSTNITPAQFIVSHSNTADADKTFGYVALG